MKLFVDANVLVTVLNKEYPLFSAAARVLSLADSYKYEVYTSPLCLAIAFYFSGKKSGDAVALRKIRMLSSVLVIANTDAAAVQKTLANRQIHDFEDGLQYYTAVDAGCQVFVTENISDFYFSEIPVLGCEDFLKRYVINK